jgi:hypothetical protein
MAQGPNNTDEDPPLCRRLARASVHGFGNDPTGYHLHNLALYALACFLVWKMALVLAAFSGQERERAEPFAAIVTVLFAVHPAHVEAVTWNSGRKDILAGVLLLVAWLAWAHSLAGTAPRRRPGAGSGGPGTTSNMCGKDAAPAPAKHRGRYNPAWANIERRPISRGTPVHA